ncbi:MAG: hypothetical protein FJ189_05165, partial [Gammaproteobacteria bacterium]|nr:hypothetical protein [Gammaproteobacteria bacterium]
MNGTTLNFDRVTRTAPLGMRFADAVTASPVGGGLKVELFSLVNPYQRCFAAPNRSGVYVVHDLPGSSDSGRG